jgi:sucrose-6-phosphate hydrolase SacC (GH32 family)
MAALRVALLALAAAAAAAAAAVRGGAANECPQYHSFRGNQDPSGPVQTPDGVWHVFPINESWGHCTSPDLLHWNCSHPATGWPMPNTGAVSVTPAGLFIMQADNFNVSMARATGADMNDWVHFGVIGAPAQPYPATMSLSDTGRALQLRSGLYVPVGVRGPGNVGGGIHWFKADDDSLTHIVEVGFLFTTNVSLGPLLECPDVFELDGKVVVLGSFPGPDSCYACGTSHWWVGSISDDDRTFTPEATGRFDYGLAGYSSLYAAKSGTQALAPFSRRLLFGFGGWHQEDMSSCNGWYVLPRELSLSPAGTLLHYPAVETEALRQGPAVQGLAAGGQIEAWVRCRLPPALPSSGVVGLSTLQSGNQSVLIGVDFATLSAFADVPACLGRFGNTSRTDRAPLASALQGDAVELRVWVDGQMIESFFGGEVSITTATSNFVASAALTSSFVNTAALDCNVTSWVLSL